jgi:hypothetical protein
LEVLTIGGFVVGLLGLASIPVSVALARRSRQTPDLRVARDFDEVVPKGDWLLRGGLLITFEDKALERVSRTYFAIWNHRGDTVRGSEVLAADPLRVEVGEGDEVLQARVVASSRTQLGMDVQPSGRTATVTFDFMDGGDGAVIEVLHYGDTPANLVGTIPGARITRPRRANLSPEGRRRIRTGQWRALSPLDRFFTLAMGITITLGFLVTAFGVVATTIAGRREPELADVSVFDLETTSGQAEFAREVTRLTGDYGVPVVAMFAALAVLMAFVVLGVVAFTRYPVPKSVVALDSDPDEDEPRLKRRSRRLPRSERSTP